MVYLVFPYLYCPSETLASVALDVILSIKLYRIGGTVKVVH